MRNLLLALVAAVALAMLVIVVGVGVGSPSSPAVAEPADSASASNPTNQYVTDALDMMESGGYYVDPATWPAQRTEAEQLTNNAPDTAATYPALRAALAAAGGEHSEWLPPGAPLVDPNPVESTTPSVTTTPDGISTVSVPELVSGDPQALQRYADSTASSLSRAGQPTSCGWIVDLRDNGGGNMWPMFAGLSPLLADGPMLSFASNTGERTEVRIEGGTALAGAQPQASVVDLPKSTKPIAVLQGESTASSGEAVLLAFRGQPNVRTIGSDSAGSSTANMSVPMPDGATMVLTTAVYVDRFNQAFGGRITPDLSAPDALVAARTWLHEQCG
ncbi:MAG: S41 family peptidase [Pseudonocardia sp.]